MELNDQIQILSNSKARFSMMLSEARSNLAADREEVKAKEMQKINVDEQYIAFMKKCCERVKWIMFQDMCALIVVRNAVMESSTTCPGEEIVDCEVDNWVGKKCSVPCDDSCPAVPDPTEVYECGGWQEINRKVVVQPPDECGLRCSALSRTKKCNQIKCPVDCVISEWSGSCTAEYTQKDSQNDVSSLETSTSDAVEKVEMEIKGVEAEFSKETKIYNGNDARTMGISSWPMPRHRG